MIKLTYGTGIYDWCRYATAGTHLVEGVRDSGAFSEAPLRSGTRWPAIHCSTDDRIKQLLAYAAARPGGDSSRPVVRR